MKQRPKKLYKESMEQTDDSLLKKINKIYKPLTSLTKMRKEKTKLLKSGTKKRRSK
jgi:pantothenate kinase